MAFVADDLVTAVNTANDQLAAAGLPVFDLPAFTAFLARSMAQMIAVKAEADAAKAVADAQAASALAQTAAQAKQAEAAAVRAKIATL